MDEVRIREFQYTLEDVKQLREVDGLTFKECKYNDDEILEVAMERNNQIFVAEIHEKIVGFISMMQVKTLHYNGLWVDLIAVHPDYQNRGIAGNLLERGKKLGDDLGVNFVSGLVAMENTASQKTFLNQGFHAIDKNYHLLIYDRE